MRAVTRRSRTLSTLLLVLVATLIGVGCVYSGYLSNMLPTAAAELDELTLPPGFRIAVYAADVPNARQMALGPPGVVFVGSRSEGKVYAVVDRDGGNRTVHVVASGLNQPSGVAFRDGALYVAAVNRILRYRDVARDPTHPPKPEVVTDAYPSDPHHGWKFIAFGPDGRLYVAVGAPCNICTPPGPLHATITRLDLAGGRPEVVARGVRNSVGFDFDPVNGDLWFTDNGRDWLGDDQPPDELNHLTKVGERFGFPFCHGNGRRDPEHNAGHACGEFTPPARELGPHVAAIGMRFYTGRMFPEKYRRRRLHRRARFVESLDADRLPRLLREDRERARHVVRALRRGLAQGRRGVGPPADVLVMPDGALLVSDDKAGRIYRITYAGNG